MTAKDFKAEVRMLAGLAAEKLQPEQEDKLAKKLEDPEIKNQVKERILEILQYVSNN